MALSGILPDTTMEKIARAADSEYFFSQQNDDRSKTGTIFST